MKYTTETTNIMASLKRRLNHLSRLETTACGWDEEVDKAARYRIKTEEWLASEIDRIILRAGAL